MTRSPWTGPRSGFRHPKARATVGGAGVLKLIFGVGPVEATYAVRSQAWAEGPEAQPRWLSRPPGREDTQGEGRREVFSSCCCVSSCHLGFHACKSMRRAAPQQRLRTGTRCPHAAVEEQPPVHGGRRGREGGQHMGIPRSPLHLSPGTGPSAAATAEGWGGGGGNVNSLPCLPAMSVSIPLPSPRRIAEHV